jgi:hypothetical protein
MSTAPKNELHQPHGLSLAHISHSIGLARVLLICGLIALHYGIYPGSNQNSFEGIDLTGHPFATWFNSFVVFYFHSAVPLLSMISGWLFFTFLPEDAWSSIFRRMRGRLFTVYLPVCAWNTFYLVLIYAAFRHNPHASAFTHATRFGIDFFHATKMDYINAVFAVTSYPIGFQFWFVRDLFVTALISPVLWLLISRAPWAGAIALGVMWLIGWNLYIFLRLDVPFFFYMGALIHQKHFSIVMPTRFTILAVACYVILAGLRALAPTLVAFPNHVAPHWIEVATRFMRFFGVLGCWGIIYRLAETKGGIALSKYGGIAFFVHSAHWPLEAILKEALHPLIRGNSDFWLLLHYFVTVLLTITISVTAALTLARFCPRVFSLMNGGRLLGQTRNSQPEAVDGSSGHPQATPA